MPEDQLNQLKQMTNQLNNYLQQIAGYAQRCSPLVQNVPLAHNYLQNVVESASHAGDIAQSLLETLYQFDALEGESPPAQAAVSAEPPAPALLPVAPPPPPIRLQMPQKPPAAPPLAPPAPTAPELVVDDQAAEETHLPSFPGRGGTSPDDPVVRLRTADLPALDETAASRRAPPPSPTAPQTVAAGSSADLPVENPSGSHELIMLVDDDEHVLLLAKMILIEADYKILTAANGLEAIKLYQKGSQLIQLVILDYAMPIMDGSEVFEELRAINPRALVLLSSGFTEQSKLNQMLSQGLRGFLPKPYTREKMLLQVRSAIDGSRA